MLKRMLALLVTLLMVSGAALANEPSPVDVSQPVELTIMARVDARTIDPADMGMWQRAAEAANVTIKWDIVRSGWDEKKAVVLASNNLPDIFFNGLTDADIITNVESFVELSQLIRDCAPNAQKMLDGDLAARAKATFPDGSVYSLPMLLGFRPQSATVLMVNQQWLDKLGLKAPTTLDELEQVLIAFRDGDPNGNGEKDEIPLDWPAPGSAHDIYALTGAYGVVDDQVLRRIVLTDGKVDFLYTTEAYKNITAFLHKLYAEGLINPEVFTNDYNAATALSTQGDVPRVGVTTGYSTDSRTGKFFQQYTVIPQLKVSADSAIEVRWPSNGAQMNGGGNTCVISKSCKYPERAMALINQVYAEEFAIQNYYGSYPEHVQKNDDGTWEILVPKDGLTIEESKWIYGMVDYGSGYFSKDLESRTSVPSELTRRIDQDDVYEDIRLAPEQIYPMIKFTSEDTEELVYLSTDIQKLVNQKMAEWIVKGGVEAEWDAYIQSLENMGLERMREIYQKAYDHFMGN